MAGNYQCFLTIDQSYLYASYRVPYACRHTIINLNPCPRSSEPEHLQPSSLCNHFFLFGKISAILRLFNYLNCIATVTFAVTSNTIGIVT